MENPQSADEIEVLLFEESPYGAHLAALVQSDGRTVYLYLHGAGSFGTRACWVRNLQPGPWVFSEQDLTAGRPPLLPKVHVAPQSEMTVPDRSQLRFVWFPPGNGVFLLSGDDLLAIIPPWSGEDGFHGYARDCTSDNLVCWPLPDRAEWSPSLEAAEAFWSTWCHGRCFEDAQPQWLAALARRFGDVVEYYSIDGGRFPPRGAACFQTEQATIIVTVGMSLCPQPNAPTAAAGSSRKPAHIELGLRIPPTDDRETLRGWVQRLSGAAQLPWTQWTWLGPGQWIETSGGEGPIRFQLVADEDLDLLWLVPGEGT